MNLLPIHRTRGLSLALGLVCAALVLLPWALGVVRTPPVG